MGTYKYKQTSNAYDIMGEKKILRKSEKKEKAKDGYVCIDDCSKQAYARAQHSKLSSFR